MLLLTIQLFDRHQHKVADLTYALLVFPFSSSISSMSIGMAAIRFQSAALTPDLP